METYAKSWEDVPLVRRILYTGIETRGWISIDSSIYPVMWFHDYPCSRMYTFWSNRSKNSEKDEFVLQNVQTSSSMCLRTVLRVLDNKRGRESKTYALGEKWHGYSKLDLSVGMSKACGWHLIVCMLWDESHSYQAVSTFGLSHDSRSFDWEESSIAFWQQHLCRSTIFPLSETLLVPRTTW